MICNKCGKENPDGGKFCCYCGNSLCKENHSKHFKSIIIIGISIGVLLVCFVTALLIKITRSNKTTVIDNTNIKNDEKPLNITTEISNSTMEDTEEIIEDEEDSTEEEFVSEHYYLVKSVSNRYNSGKTDTLEYDFDNKSVTVGLDFTGDLIHPEVDIPYYEQDITWFFYPKTICPYIDNYQFKYDNELLGEEKLQFDNNDLNGFVITDYEFELGETYNCSVENKNTDNYVVKDKNEKVILTYDYDGHLLNINNGNKQSYNIDFSYDSEGRLKEIYRVDDIYISLNRFEYNDSDNTAYEYVEGEENPLVKYYYDDNNVCYKKVDLSDNSETTYEYIDVECNGDDIQYKDYEFLNIDDVCVNEGETDVVTTDNDYSQILDDYYNVLKQVYNGDYSEVDSFVERYNIYGDGFNDQSIFTYRYAYKDINGDGLDELFIYLNKGIASVYTVKDGKFYNLANGWSRNNVYICNDNTIYTIGYGGASTTVYTSYVMNDSADGVYVKDLYAYDAAGLSIDEPDYVGNSYEDDRFWFYSTSEEYWDDGINTTYSEAQTFIEEQESKIITIDDTIPLSNYKNEMVMESFYGIWCYRSKNMEDAVDFMNNYDVGYILPQMFLTTDWENLNSEPYYAVTIGVYRTQERAENELSRVQEQYPDAYIEYSGKYIGE